MTATAKSKVLDDSKNDNSSIAQVNNSTIKTTTAVHR